MRTTTTATLLIALSLAAAGCGESQAPAPAPRAPAVDPRFASADALLEHYNDLTSGGPRVEAAAVLDLMYAENDVQKKLLAATREVLPLMELEQAMWERFGEGLNVGRGKAPLAAKNQPAQMARREEARAEATELEDDGSESTVHLVRMGDRWWISGYTLEYRSQLVESVKAYEAMPAALKAAYGAAGDLRRRLEAGEFASASDLRRTFMETAAERAAAAAAREQQQEQQQQKTGVSRSLTGG